MNTISPRAALVSSLRQRWRPEDTVPHIETLIGDQLASADARVLKAALPRWRRSSMATAFTQAATLDKTADTIARLDAELEAAPQRSRLANRRARLARTLDKRTGDWRRRLPALAQFAETVFAPTLTAADLADDRSLCFVAYLTARMGLRSTFTNTAQDKPFDTVAEMLLRQVSPDDGNWYAIACVFPRADVLARLSQDQKLTLLDQSRVVLEEVAGYLRKTAESGDINLKTMIVKKGNDSSTWNALAGAWNRARDWYFAALAALGWVETLDLCCPGKVLRLMAGDVVYWHTFSKGSVTDSLHPDTRVWGELPAPWLVLNGEKRCTRKMVERICQKHGVDPVKSGWIGPRERAAVEAFRPTPELVYGVEVGHPALAAFLRKVGVFSGKGIRVPEAFREPSLV